LINLISLSVNFIAIATDWYVIGYYLKYVGGNLFVNNLASGIATAIAYGFSGVIANLIGSRRLLFVTYIVGIAFAIPLLIIDKESESSAITWIIIICVFGSRLGMSAGFMMVYLVIAEAFPSLFVTSAIMFCNFFSRISSIFAPQIAEFGEPLPMIFYLALAVCGLLASFFYKKPKNRVNQLMEV
jgi:MFS family permease